VGAPNRAHGDFCATPYYPGFRDALRFTACEKFSELFDTLVKRSAREIPDREGLEAARLRVAGERASTRASCSSGSEILISRLTENWRTSAPKIGYTCERSELCTDFGGAGVPVFDFRKGE